MRNQYVVGNISYWYFVYLTYSYLILDIKSSSDSSKETLGQAKKTTWASIASQPAKPQLTVQNQGLKKKGPGMPPGPIVPGKMDMIGTWDTQKSTPPQLPMMNNASAPKPMTQAAMNVRPGWNGPPTTRPAPPSVPRTGPPQHPNMPSYQPQAPLMQPHLPPPVSMPQGLLPPGGGESSCNYF